MHPLCGESVAVQFRARPVSIGLGMQASMFFGYLGIGYGRIGQLASGVDALDKAFELAARTGERFFEAELRRMNASLRLRAGDVTGAEQELELALAVARQQEARLWELRAAASLARLWRDQDKRAEAYEILQPVYAWFIEGFDTADLKDAKALLDELSDNELSGSSL